MHKDKFDFFMHCTSTCAMVRIYIPTYYSGTFDIVIGMLYNKLLYKGPLLGVQNITIHIVLVARAQDGI